MIGEASTLPRSGCRWAKALIFVGCLAPIGFALTGNVGCVVDAPRPRETTVTPSPVPSSAPVASAASTPAVAPRPRAPVERDPAVGGGRRPLPGSGGSLPLANAERTYIA